jgi:hypothetical protein
MALDHDYVVDTAELPASTFGTRPLSALKCQVMFHYAESLTPAVNPPGLFCLTTSQIFLDFCSIYHY